MKEERKARKKEGKKEGKEEVRAVEMRSTPPCPEGNARTT